MIASILGFDFCEVLAAGEGFGLRDFAADIIGGAGVQGPDGGFVQNVIRVLIPTRNWWLHFGDGAFGLVRFIGLFG